jgi:ribosome biogenesis protein MAK21
MSDRYYRTLYELLLRVHLTHKPAALDEFFALVFKSVKSDKNPARTLAFVRRILQMATLNDSAYTAASLLIVSELIREKPDLRFQLYTLEQITGKRTQNQAEDSEEEHFYDADKLQ